MSSKELASRMGVSQSAASEMERREVLGTIRLDTLRRAADALECDLLYRLVPRRALEETVYNQARIVADRNLGLTIYGMGAPGEIVTSANENMQLHQLIGSLIDSKGLWS